MSQMRLSIDPTGTQFVFNDAIPTPVTPGKFSFTVDSNTAGQAVYPKTGFNPHMANAPNPPVSLYRNGAVVPVTAYTYNSSGSVTLTDGSKFVLGEILTFGQ
jgi:hypothetical protein